MPKLPLDSGHGTMLALADIIERTVGGTSSAIYCIFLSALGAGLSKYGSSNVAEWAKGNTAFPLFLDFVITHVIQDNIYKYYHGD